MLVGLDREKVLLTPACFTQASHGSPSSRRTQHHVFQASATSTPSQANVVATQPSFSFSFEDETAIGLESELADNGTRDHLTTRTMS